MANSDVKLKNKKKEPIYPITRERNVYDANNVPLDKKLEEVVFKDNEVFKFSQEQYEESANLFDEQVERGNVDNNTGLFTRNSTGNSLVDFNYIPMKPNTIYSYKTSKSGLWIYEYDSNKNFLGYVDIVSGSSFTSKSDTSYFRVAFWGGYGTTYLNDAIVKEGTNPVYHPFNQKNHITNSEAEFLKDEHENSLNLISEEEINITGYNIIWGYIYGLKPNTTYTFKTYAGYIGGSNLKLETKDGTLVQDVVTDWSLNLQNQVAKITTGNNVSENGMYRLHLVGTYSDSAVTRDCMLVEGSYTFATMPSYVPYNQSSHITNGQADLLKSEHEKQLNLMKSITIETGTTYQYGASIYGEFDNRVEVGKTYTLVFDTENTGASFYRNEQIFEQTFSFTADGKRKVYIGKIISLSGNALFKNNLDNSGKLTSTFIKNVMLLEGDWSNKPIPNYQEWNGEIIHEKDIEPVTLWENKTPNVAFAAQSPNLTKEVKVGDVLDVCYKMNTTSGSKVEQVYINEMGKYCRLIDASSNIRYREITPNGNTVYFGSGYLDGSQDDNVMIPLWIKLRRY